jgi:hypothetical protein
MRYARDSWSFQPPQGADALSKRAYPAAWKASPAPLLRLLESALNELVCDFAIRSLRGDHPLALRAVEPAWLAQLGRRPIAVIHTFVVQLLKESPELHQSRLRQLGLHDVVIGLLRSPSPEARAFALEYAAAHAPICPVSDLVELVEHGADAERSSPQRDSRHCRRSQIGVPLLARLLAQAATPWAGAKLAQGFGARELDAETFIATAHVEPPRTTR